MASFRVIIHHLINKGADRFLKGARRGSLFIDAFGLLHMDDRFDIQQGGQQPFDVADAPAVYKIFEFIQSEDALQPGADLLQHGQNLLHAPAGIVGVAGGSHDPARTAGQRFRIEEGDVCFRHKLHPLVCRVVGAAQSGGHVDGENFWVMFSQPAVNFSKIAGRRLGGYG